MLDRGCTARVNTSTGITNKCAYINTDFPQPAKDTSIDPRYHYQLWRSTKYQTPHLCRAATKFDSRQPSTSCIHLCWGTTRTCLLDEVCVYHCASPYSSMEQASVRLRPAFALSTRYYRKPRYEAQGRHTEEFLLLPCCHYLVRV